MNYPTLTRNDAIYLAGIYGVFFFEPSAYVIGRVCLDNSVHIIPGTYNNRLRAIAEARRLEARDKGAAGDFPEPYRTYVLFYAHELPGRGRVVVQSAEVDVPFAGCVLMGQTVKGPDWPVFVSRGDSLAIRDDFAKAYPKEIAVDSPAF